MSDKNMRCSVNALEFTALLRDVLVSASTDRALPMLNGVALRWDASTGDQLLTATSTDRFRLAQATVNCSGFLPEMFVSLDEAKKLVAVLKVYTEFRDVGSGSVLTLESGKGALTAKFVGSGRQGLVIPVTPRLPHPHDPFYGGLRKLAKLVRDAEASTTPERFATFNPEFVADFCTIASARDTQVRFQMQGAFRPALVFIGEHYRALLMPVRDDDPVTSPWFWPELPEQSGDAPRLSVVQDEEADRG
ncbi:DNA polymerase III subunit beta family protein [Lentzea chajnantorensis]